MHALTIPVDLVAIGNLPIPAGVQPAGYAAILAAYHLNVPPPHQLLAISQKHTLRQEGPWRILTPRYRPSQTIACQLEFALRHEGVDLAILNALFQTVPAAFIEEWVQAQ